MASTQKKRFSFFGSPPMSPILSPTKSFSNYFSSQEKQDDKLHNVDDVRKAIDNLERLVLAADAYRDLLNKLNKASKTFSKALKDYGNSKGMENVHVMCLQTTSQFYDNHAEIQSKLNKVLQKDFEAIQKFWDKYSKRVAKNEKTHNDYVGDLDKQLKKMNKDYEKKTKKDNKASMESHNQYMTSITTIGSDIARAQKEYVEKVAKREKRTHSVISQIVCKLAEGQFSYFNDSLKKCGPSITKMKEWAPFAGEDMPQPQDLDVFLDDQTSQLQSDKNSTISDRKTVSIASISEKQIAAMNFSSQESKLSFNEEPENIIPTKYVQMPEPKFPVITTPETTKPTYAHPNSLTLGTINNNNKKNDEISNSSSSTSSVPSTPIVQPTSVLSFYSASLSPSPSPTPSLTHTQPSNSKSSDLISRFSIGIRDNDNPFLRDEKAVEIHPPEVFMEKKVEKSVLSQNFCNQSTIQEEEKTNESLNLTNVVKKNETNKSLNISNDVMKNKTNESTNDVKKNKTNESLNITNDVKKNKTNESMNITYDVMKNKTNEYLNITNDVKKNNENEKKGNEKNENQPENKGIFTHNNIVHDRDNVSDDSNTTLNDDKKNTEKSNGELKIKETKKEVPPSDKSNENNGTIELISETINKPIKDEGKEITNEKKSLIENFKPNLNINDDDKSVNQFSSPIPSENPSEHPFNSKEISLNNSQRQIQYSRDDDDDDYKKENSRKYEQEDTEYYQGSYNNEMNRYINRDIIHRDESLLYDSSVHGGKMRYNDTNLNYHRPQQYIEDDYESYDYVPSQNHGSYVMSDRLPPRTSLPYLQRSYNNNIPMHTSRRSSVREITSRFQSMNEERRPVTPSTRNIPMPTPGRVSEITSRFGERRDTRNEVINPSNSRGGRNYGYESVNNRYNEPTDYRYIQYDDDLHDGITPVRHCNCHNCQIAVENTIRVPSRHTHTPFTESNFIRKSYN